MRLPLVVTIACLLPAITAVHEDDLVTSSTVLRPTVAFDTPWLAQTGYDFFGASLVFLGDRRIAVGCPRAGAGGERRGAVFTLSLDASGDVDASTPVGVITSSMGGDHSHFGTALAAADIDGDGILDLIVGADSEPVGSGFVEIVFGPDAAQNGSAPTGRRAHLAEGVGGVSAGDLAPLRTGDRFGSALTVLRDMDGDSILVIATTQRKCRCSHLPEVRS